MHEKQREDSRPCPLLNSDLLVARSAAEAALHADCHVADVDGLGESRGKLQRPTIDVARGDGVGDVFDGAVDELLAHSDDLLRVVPETTALSWVGRTGGSSRGGRGGAGAGESGGVARRSSGRVCDSSGGSRESRGVVVGANAMVHHVDGHEALVAIEAQVPDGTLDALEKLLAELRLLLVVGAREAELVAANLIVPGDGTSRRNAGGRVAHAVLVAAVLVADLLVGEVYAKDVVEDGAAVGPGRVLVVGRQDVEDVALVGVPLVGSLGRHGS